CRYRRECCNNFRYGQCNTQIGGVTEVVCRVISCRPPWKVRGWRCNRSYARDDTTCSHEAVCECGDCARRRPSRR
ncbi:MAG TPA: hypothetical protein VGR10_02540, partial [Thermoleophilaceae bacterium]|nr:hypothetical protein [Thermoleophilaceae bacterium]